MAHQVTVSWTASVTPGVTYNIYRGTNPPGNEGATPLNSTPITVDSYIDLNVTAGESVDYVVTAVLNGIESIHSNEVTVTVPVLQSDVQPPTNVTAVAL